MTESVWDYPRPPRVEPTERRIRVVHRGDVIVDTRQAVRVLETSHPPTYYVPLVDVAPGTLEASGGRRAVCEWKGAAAYLDVVVDGARVERAAWTFPNPSAGFEELAERVAFYAQSLDECYVDDERIVPQAGTFYGGWITADLIGPFKGAPGTLGW
jgi:uncharacterized protein (DUF427 family)